MGRHRRLYLPPGGNSAKPRCFHRLTFFTQRLAGCLPAFTAIRHYTSCGCCWRCRSGAAPIVACWALCTQTFIKTFRDRRQNLACRYMAPAHLPLNVGRNLGFSVLFTAFLYLRLVPSPNIPHATTPSRYRHDYYHSLLPSSRAVVARTAVCHCAHFLQRAARRTPACFFATTPHDMVPALHRARAARIRSRPFWRRIHTCALP